MTKKLTLIKRSVPVCPQCVSMQQALDNEGVSYEVIDITERPEAVEQYGLSSVPVMFIDEEGSDQIRLNGFKPVELVKSLLQDDE